MEKPGWWPKCPWPKDVWVMSHIDYTKAVPDPKIRTAISGLLMRKGWEIAEEDIYKRLKENLLGVE
jgi:hypothetical protein